MHTKCHVCGVRCIAYKSSAIAEMGDSLPTIDMDRKVGAAVPLSVLEQGPYLTLSLGPRPIFAPNGILIHAAVWPQ